VDQRSFTRGTSQIWLEVKEESKKKNLFYFAPSKNLLSKYGNFGIFSSECDDFGSFFSRFLLYAWHEIFGFAHREEK
jgi:hypothetical protein